MGYRDALGGEYDERLVVTGDYSQASGLQGMQRLLAAAPDLDAVFVASDVMASGRGRGAAARPAGASRTTCRWSASTTRATRRRSTRR